MASFDDYIQMQEQLNKQFNVLLSPLGYSCSGSLDTVARLNQMAYSPIQEWEESYTRMFAPIQEMLNNLTNSSAASIAAAFQDSSVLAASFQEIIPPDIAQNFENLNTFSVEQFSTAFNPLFSAIDNIRIFPDHIEVPDELVPENFIKSPDATQSQYKPDVKRLSRSDAIALIAIIIAVLAWLFPNPLSGFQSESEPQVRAIITQEQGNLIIEYLAKLYECMNAIANQQNNPNEPTSVSDSNFPYIQSEAATPPNATQPRFEVPAANDNIQPQSEAE
jgi:hypothetical protein